MDDIATETPVSDILVSQVGDINVEFDIDDLKITDADADDRIALPTEITSKKKQFGIKWIYDIIVFQEDKISEFKEKLFLITGIPIYRQHLWNEHKEHTYPMSYLLYQHDIRIYVDINVAIKLFIKNSSVDKVEGIPVNMELYSNKNNIRVIANDEFRILKDIYEVRGTTNYKIIDAGDFLSSIKDNLEKMISPNKNQFDLSFEMIYYSFVLKYFPIVSIPEHK